MDSANHIDDQEKIDSNISHPEPTDRSPSFSADVNVNNDRKQQYCEPIYEALSNTGEIKSLEEIISGSEKINIDSKLVLDMGQKAQLQAFIMIVNKDVNLE